MFARPVTPTHIYSSLHDLQRQDNNCRRGLGGGIGSLLWGGGSGEITVLSGRKNKRNILLTGQQSEKKYQVEEALVYFKHHG